MIPAGRKMPDGGPDFYVDGSELSNLVGLPGQPLGWWAVRGVEINLAPALDLRPHVVGKGCWCRPVDDGETLVHNALDQRDRHLEDGAPWH